jgi:predicted ABC-type ATPase
MTVEPPTLTIVAGPNGSGKTTFVQAVFKELVSQQKFLNADHVAQELSPNDTNKVAFLAGRKFLTEIDNLIARKESFVIETTLAGKSLLRIIQQAKERDFVVCLIFLWIDSINLCDFRVKGRVAAGGHNIPYDIIVRRYKRGLKNGPLYFKEVHRGKVYLANETPILIVNFTHPNKNEVINQDLYKKFLQVIGSDKQTDLRITAHQKKGT